MSKNLRNPSAQLNPLAVNERLGVMGYTGRNQSAVKLADQTVNNSAVLVNDAELSIYLGTAPKNCYYVRATIQLAIAAAANNVRYAFAGPDGLVLAATSRWFGTFLITGVVPQVDSNQTALASAVVGGTTNAWTQLLIEGVICPEQPGTLVFQFAQNVAGATNTTVKAGSSLMAWEVPA